MENIFFDIGKLKYLGVGAIIGKCVRIRKPEHVSVGDYSIIDDFTYISCELEVGRYCHIASNVTISGGQGKVRTGDCVGIAAGCTIHPASSDYLLASLDLPSVPAGLRFGGSCEPIQFDEHVLLGSHTVVLPGVHLPAGCATTASTVVRKRKYSEWTLYGGYECRKLCCRSKVQLMGNLASWYNTDNSRSTN